MSEKLEIIDNENQKLDKKIMDLKENSETNLIKKEALLILTKIDNNIKADIDLAFDKNYNRFYIIKDWKPVEWWNFDIEWLKNIAVISEVFKEHKFDIRNNKLVINSEKIAMDSWDWRLNDEGKLLKGRWNKTYKWWEIDKHFIEITNSDNRNIIADMLDDNLKVMTELRDEDLQKYVDVLNQIL